MILDDVDYLNKSIWAELRPSPLHGIGVFAIRTIPMGTCITQHTVNHPIIRYCLVRAGNFDLIHPAIQKIILNRTAFPAGGDYLIFPCPNCEQCLQSFINHSDTPNFCESVVLRHIAEGEELVEDYKKLQRELNPLTKQHWQSFI